jgi:Reverse transcriptase (RNA-dependent DNA polymerase)
LLDDPNPDLEGNVPNRDDAAPTITTPSPNLAIDASDTPGSAIPLRRSTRITRGQTRQRIDNSWNDVNDDGTIRSHNLVTLTAEDNEISPLLHAVLLPDEPASYREAVKSTYKDDWDNAMQEEMKSLSENHTWDLVDLPKDRRAVKCKWVYCIKFGADGKPNRFKARLVAKGFTQILGLDYDETFSPVTRLDSIRILLALATLEDWEIHQIDVKMAFLNGDLDEEIYMQQPEGFITAGQSGKVCRLRKALYGLKQASRQWHHKLHSALGKIRFQRTQGDHSIYL